MKHWWLDFSVVLTALALAVSLYVFYADRELLPESVPVHWGINGQPDRFVERDDMLPYLMIPPGVMAFLVVLWPLLPWLSPKRFEVDTFRATYDQIMGLLVVLMGYLHVAILWAYVHPGTESVRLIIAGICLFLALIGNLLGKVKRNFWMGIRTPWTLASEPVWERTHRLGAWLFVVAGLTGFVATLLGAPLWLLFVLIVIAALVPVVYSLVIYKRLEKQGRLGLGPDPQQLEEQR
jgi:uncharacterized membrane protein